MRNLRSIRIFVTIVMLAAALGYMILQPTVNPVLNLARASQIVPSAIAGARGVAVISLGAALFWLLFTFIYGRVYCSSVCPIGSIQDAIIWVRRKITRRPVVYRYKHPNRWRWHFLIIYIVCLFAGIGIITLLMEPWRMFGVMVATVRHEEMSFVWEELGWGLLGGMLAGGLSFILIFIYALWKGRDFCNVVCPIGTILGKVSEKSIYQIRFDPDKCVGCLKCEQACKAGCLKVVSRYVDNSRCIRCFDCINACENEAIRYDKARPRFASPLLRKADRVN